MSARVDVHMQNGLVVARLQVGTCVYVCQGPPIEVQLLQTETDYVWCPSEEVQKNARFAEMQSKRNAADDRQPRCDPPELDAMRPQGHGW